MATQEVVVNIRDVYAHNLEEEFELINSVLPYFRYVSIDTEFPGTVIEADKPYYCQSAEDVYESMKKNVNATKIIQLGLTLADDNGRFPKIGSDHGSIWQFNFDFDVDSDTSNSESIKFLKSHGIEFDKHKANGIDSKKFASLFLDSELGVSLKSFHDVFLKGKGVECYSNNYNPLIWITFQGLCDVGYLMNILCNHCLSDYRLAFSVMVRVYFGFYIFDVKEIIQSLGLRGGLNKVADQLGVTRIGQSHHAGSDSFLTSAIFMKLRKEYFPGQQILRFNLKMKGLEEDESKVREMMMSIKNYSRNARNTTFCHPLIAFPVQFYHPHPVMFRQAYPSYYVSTTLPYYVTDSTM